MQKIRVIEAVNQLGLGGTEYAVQLFSKFLNKEYFDITVVSLLEGGPRVKMIEDLGIKVIQLNGDIDKLAGLLRETDVFHWHGYGSLDAELFNIIKANRPKLVIQTNVFGYYEESPFYDLLDYDLYPSKMTLIRRMEKDKHLKDNFSSKRKVLHNPVDVDQLTSFLPSEQQVISFKKEYKLESAFIVGRIGRADDYKFDLVTLDSFAKFAVKINHAKFLLVGATPKMLAHAESLGITDKMVVLNNTSDLKQLLIYYKAMDIFLAASEIGESFGMIIAEAMTVGVPVVTICTKTRDNAQVELVDNHKTGLVVKRKEKKLADALLFLYKNKSIRAHFATASKEKVINEYKANKIAMSLEILILKHFGCSNGENKKTLLLDFSEAMVEEYEKRCLDLHRRSWIVKKIKWALLKRKFL